ncbi:TonB-dependent receptor plug domain-containing protein [Pseudobacteriovorax antillogorgiicola]|uniref:Outer membrane receptor proteins, mostly Fe transport n=1 Tax=Pseudobacteriovorax antillogorgiicola TaxID=1513793 RepID=A0A1Y6CCU7_9BACT|nr:TonB-dependent receptor [Pseudobacteriovorax antillogorgiicola]TCS48249.1 outer membrane receptor protein involved in Fe transport [Pseudobacteriovorax antillogorgiicola]SMF57251.1 Outer membrane receptor proteins, mostly Fe transport [Pseudobacteriovorax antillogorgiicola]
MHTHRSKFTWLLLGILVSPPIQADVERVEVTGTRIKRMDIEGSANLQIIDRERIEQLGAANLSDVLRGIAANNFGSWDSGGLSSASNVAHANIRGLGESRTLVLINGRRLERDTNFDAVDLNMIPVAAVERIDIMKEGASAIYGSDALAGVINVITKKTFQGVEASIEQRVTEEGGGNETRISATGGFSTERANLIVVASFKKRDELARVDRPWVVDRNRMVSSLGSPYGRYRSLADKSKFYFGPNCPDNLQRSDGCGFKYMKERSLIPAEESASVFIDSSYELNASHRVFLGGRVTNRNNRQTIEPHRLDFEILPGDEQLGLFNGLGLTTGDGVEVQIAMPDQRVDDENTLNYQYSGGIKGDIVGSWEYEVFGGFSRSFTERTRTQGEYLEQESIAAIKSVSSDDLFNLSKNASLFDPYAVTTDRFTESLTTESSIVVSGDLFELPGGYVGVSFGGTQQYSEINQGQDQLIKDEQTITGPGFTVNNDRTVNSLFAEMVLPVSDSIELSFAGRYDSYSDYGNTTNPKAAFKWEPLKQLSFRGSASRAFKAPPLQELGLEPFESSASVKDDQGCRIAQSQNRSPEEIEEACDFITVILESGGNPNLKEENANFLNVGMVFEPSRRFYFSADYWVLEVENGLDQGESEQAIFDAAAKGIDITKYGASIERPDGESPILKAPILNIAGNRSTGIDLKIQHNYRVLPTLTLAMTHDYNQFLEKKREDFPGLGFTSVLGNYLNPRWTAVNAATLSWENQNLTLLGTSIDKHRKIDPDNGYLSRYTRFDLQYRYQNDFIGTVALGAINAFADRPPTDPDSIIRVTKDIYNVRGRTFYAKLTRAF